MVGDHVIGWGYPSRKAFWIGMGGYMGRSRTSEMQDMGFAELQSASEASVDTNHAIDGIMPTYMYATQ